jgi:PAS domain S-box-containing protein
MHRSFRLLMVEDSEDDALLIVRELRRADYDVTFERVDTPESMAAALAHKSWDLILSDYTMPHFSGVAALELLQTSGLDIPFIIVSGSIGEDLAVDAMKAGAHDYMMKGNVHRLIPSIERELRDAEVRRERKRVAEALQESEARKRAILDAAPDCIVTIDHRGNIVEFNPAAERTFGYRYHAIIGKPITDLIISRFERMDDYLRTGEGSMIGKRIETIAMRADRAEFPVEVTITRISQREPPMFTAYIRDLTEQKAQEAIRRRSEELEEQNSLVQEANRLKSEFLANMSHELRTPLNAIIGFSELLIDEKAGPITPQQKDYLTDVLTSGRHLLQLISDVLDLAKVEAGKMELNPETFFVRRAIDEVCAVMVPIAWARNIRISIEAAPTAVATLDQRKFKQVLYNLVSNAVKFSHDNAEVKVTANFDLQGQLRVEVKDFGIGIRKEDLPRLFHAFEQLESGAGRHYQGTGLGLDLTKKLVELQKGSIAVESQPGKGSTFTITLPSDLTESKQLTGAVVTSS